ncbi:MAG: zf-HC2 domain-containing protein [Ruminococcaceae bacterium]|nr:zf-HC2 domain-containing protein [Oscillospiraceae bacterium]
MNCKVIGDLLPLYIDECCSDETKTLVESHVDSCPRCKATLGQMRQEIGTQVAPKAAKKQNPIALWKASILQMSLFFLSFLAMAWGVSWEAQIPAGLNNGLFAMNLVVPVTAFMLSLANWFFIQQYRSRMQFCFWSCILHLAVYGAAFAWGCSHYSMTILDFSLYLPGTGAILTVFLGIVMWGLSNTYAKLLGKE